MITTTGVSELQAALKRLSIEVQEKAEKEIEATARATAAELKGVYPVGDTGNLRRGVRVKPVKGAREITWRTVSTAPHAHLWEYGTVNRTTAAGWNRGMVSREKNRRRGLIAIGGRRRRLLEKTLQAVVDRETGKVT